MYRLTSALAIGALCAMAACDNVGRAFDSGGTTGPTPTTGISVIQDVPEGGDLRDGRPTVKAIAPTGTGWPTSVPIAIEFSESVNEDSILPTTATGTDGKIVLRVKGTTTVLPCLYSFLAQGRLLVMRPVTPLSNQGNPSYEVVLLPDARDADGVRFQVTGTEKVLGEFQVNQDAALTDGRILLTMPRDNQRDVMRESEVLVVFDRTANTNSVTATNLVVRPTGGSALAGDLAFPLTVLTQTDGRVATFTPQATLAAGTGFELVVDDTITFGQDGVLDFRGRTPYLSFDTVVPRAPTAVHVRDFTTGFPDKINRANMAALVLQVTTPADTVAGDTVAVRIYGSDHSTAATNDRIYVERTAAAAANGTQTVDIDFTGQLGTLTNPKFDDGAVTFAMQMRRGSQHSAYAYQPSSADPRFDVTAPTLVSVGPPASTDGQDLFTDLEFLIFRGVASEPIGEAMLTDGVNPAVELFATADNGSFVMKPLTLGRLTAPRNYTLTFSDLAGNLVGTAASGQIVQRGVVTGTVAGTLTVEAFDSVTLKAIQGASVLVDPGVPTVPATGQLVATTGADGRATFTGLASSSHTVTIVRAGYDLITFYDTPAAHVSLPLRPIASNTATFTGSASPVTTTPGVTALVGNSAFDDDATLVVATTSTSPTAIPETAIQPNRLQCVTAFGGTIEPTTTPAFSLHGYAMLGPTGSSVLPPSAPADPGATSRTSVTLLPATGTSAGLSPVLTRDVSAATGLDTANLVGGKPIARVMASMQGFGGQVLAGIGAVTPVSGATYSVNGTYGLLFSTGTLTAFSSQIWMATEARDTSGRISRHRALLFFGSLADVVAQPSIPTISTPGGPFTGSPIVDFPDTLNPGAFILGGVVGFDEVQATDGAGRRWLVLRTNGSPASGTVSIQYPDLASASVAGLATGTWSMRAVARIMISFTASTASDVVLAQRRCYEATYARSAAVNFTIQ